MIRYYWLDFRNWVGREREILTLAIICAAVFLTFALAIGSVTPEERGDCNVQSAAPAICEVTP